MFNNVKLFFYLAAFARAFLFCGNTLAAPELSSKLMDASSLRDFYGMSEKQLSYKNLRLAILDKGFEGIEAKGRFYLPNTTLFADYAKAIVDPLLPTQDHGRRLAQIVYGLLGFPDSAPSIGLFNANGLQGFRAAVKSLEDWKPDVILNTDNFATFGNFDGTGFVNKLVDSITENGNGPIWIQSAGNFSQLVSNIAYTKKIESESLWIPILSHSDGNQITITLSWNAFDRGMNIHGTKKDLDLYLFEADKDGKLNSLLTSSELRQVDTEPSTDSETNLATERVVYEVSRRTSPYWIKITQVGGSFDEDKDMLRITLQSEHAPFLGLDGKKTYPICFKNEPTKKQSILIPSDNRYAITVGDTSEEVSIGPTLGDLPRSKPDIYLDKYTAKFSDQKQLQGSNVAAAFFTAFTLAIKAKASAIEQRHILQLIKNMKTKADNNRKAEKSQRWRMPTEEEIQSVIKGR